MDIMICLRQVLKAKSNIIDPLQRRTPEGIYKTLMLTFGQQEMVSEYRMILVHPSTLIQQIIHKLIWRMIRTLM